MCVTFFQSLTPIDQFHQSEQFLTLHISKFFTSLWYNWLHSKYSQCIDLCFFKLNIGTGVWTMFSVKKCPGRENFKQPMRINFDFLKKTSVMLMSGVNFFYSGWAANIRLPLPSCAF
jgi:hypothetical protein